MCGQEMKVDGIKQKSMGNKKKKKPELTHSRLELQHKHSEANKQKKRRQSYKKTGQNDEVKNSQLHLTEDPKTSRRRPHASAECSR